MNPSASGPADGSTAPAGGDVPPRLRQSSWLRRPLPLPELDALPPWQWELTSAAELTNSRRRLQRAVVGAGVPPGDIADALELLLLVFEELASNGFRHGRAPVRASVTAAGSGWLIDVTDTATDQSPAPAVGRDPALGGLGLHLVARVSRAHGWAVQAGRKHVWAYVAVAPPA